MRIKRIKRRLALFAGLTLLLSACSFAKTSPDSESDTLVWGFWSGFNGFLELAAETYPDIQLTQTFYAGANGTGYRWAEMRADHIADFFTVNHILDEDLVTERLTDLSRYDFVSDISTPILDQVAIDGGIYYLPVNNVIYGIIYNKTLMEENGWKVPANFAELETLCAQIEEAGLIPGILLTDLTGHTFSTVFNLAKTDWLTTMEGVNWERDFLAGNATAAGMWEGTMDYVQRYIDIGMFHTDPEDRGSKVILQEYLGERKAVFCTGVFTPADIRMENGDELGVMPFISEDGSKNIYMYNTSSYIGINRHLTEPGNEKKLEDALKLMTLLFSQEGQATIITEKTPYMLSALEANQVSEDSPIHDAQEAMREGRAFPITYDQWANILSDIGQAYKEWFRGENNMDGPKCIARMDELQSSYLNTKESIYFSESTADFTIEQTARLVGKALGSAVGADAAMIPYAMSFKGESKRLSAGVTGMLFQGPIDVEVANTIAPSLNGEYAILTMTGTQARELAGTGFDLAGDGDGYPYTLVVRGGGELEDDKTYQVAFLVQSYTDETGQAYDARVEKGAIRTFLREWLTGQKTVSPDGNPWE